MKQSLLKHLVNYTIYVILVHYLVMDLLLKLTVISWENQTQSDISNHKLICTELWWRDFSSRKDSQQLGCLGWLHLARRSGPVGEGQAEEEKQEWDKCTGPGGLLERHLGAWPGIRWPAWGHWRHLGVCFNWTVVWPSEGLLTPFSRSTTPAPETFGVQFLFDFDPNFCQWVGWPEIGTYTRRLQGSPQFHKHMSLRGIWGQRLELVVQPLWQLR